MSTVAAFATPPKFMLGVWMPPATDFPKWKARGCNTMMYIPLGHDLNNWSWQTVLNGLFQVRLPAGDPVANPDAFKADVQGTPNLLGLVYGDEPDMKNEDPAAYQAQYDATKAIAPGKDVFMNFSGGYVIDWQNGPDNKPIPPEKYAAYLKATDWAGNDLYPVSGWGQPDNLQVVGQVLDTMGQWAGATGKKRYAFIELSNQNLSWVPNDRGPTVAEVLVEIWLTIVHGAEGIVYFPEQIGGGFAFDVTPTDVAASVTAANMQIEQYGSYFVDGAYQRLNTGNPNVHAALWSLPTGTLKVAVNWTGQQQSALNATFGPLEVKISEVLATPTPAPVPHPDPANAVLTQRVATVEANAAVMAHWIRTVNRTLVGAVYPYLAKQGVPGLVKK